MSLKDDKLIDEIMKEDMPEAKSSVTYSLVSKTGFPLLFTVRSQSEAELLELMSDLETGFTKRGYTPKVERSFGGVKPVQIVEGEKCPDCGAPIIKFSTKDGRQAVKCSTAKYDFNTKTASGCKYFKYLDAPTIDEPATPLQIQLLKDKNQWEEGMTKKAATARISSVIGK
jgi:hypothetical protein